MNWKKLSFGNFSPVINPQRTGHGLLRYLCALYRLKLSRKSLRLTALNIGYTIKLGSSAFVSEASIASMMFLGNYLFIRHLGEDGVACM